MYGARTLLQREKNVLFLALEAHARALKLYAVGHLRSNFSIFLLSHKISQILLCGENHSRVINR